MEVIGLDRVVRHAEAPALADGAEASLELADQEERAQRGKPGPHLDRDVAGEASCERTAPPVRVARVLAMFFRGPGSDRGAFGGPIHVGTIRARRGVGSGCASLAKRSVTHILEQLSPHVRDCTRARFRHGRCDRPAPEFPIEVPTAGPLIGIRWAPAPRCTRELLPRAGSLPRSGPLVFCSGL